MQDNLLVTLIVFLSAAVISVPFFKKIGLGSVVGYLIGGIIIGPWGIGLITNVDSILHISEFGVILLLFLIGLELKPQRLWILKKPIFGLGGLQVILTFFFFFTILSFLDMEKSQVIVISISISLSSTAFALQLLGEKNELKTMHGRSVFAILLFQDLAVIPIMAILPFLTESVADPGSQGSIKQIAVATGTILTVILAGRFLARPLFKLVASSGNHEIFTALSLLIVIGVSLLMDQVGLSMALGSFLGGVILADSEYRHELESNLEPFKGLFLGLFFLAVGMSINLSEVLKDPILVLFSALILILVKATVLFFIGKISNHSNETSLNLSVTIAQGGEFAFVILGVGVSLSILPKERADLVIAIVTLSMGLTPILGIFKDKIAELIFKKDQNFKEDTIEEQNRVIIAGFGRFGQIIARMLFVHRIGFTALEHNPDQVNVARKFGYKIYYGDASKLSLLRSAGAEQADLFILAIQDIDISIKVAELIKKHFPNLTIIARARNREHVFKLMELGIQIIRRDTFASALELAGETLRKLGFMDSEVEKKIKKFRAHDELTLKGQFQIRNDEKEFIKFSKNSMHQLEVAFEADRQEKEGKLSDQNLSSL
ncbi:monovalent cation:proton antiporter-2 (CPA2) family protein [Leptospira borgpetersenii]|uniref:Transporter, CPA2 family n=1 Tax=Leptospira borgpetersenii serovar Ballum TaxID=280505 RepID=A0A0E3BBL6_LEPBO|nr:monovalent cation:proton antiporter-2 (CPA2) family protein [Leptospira borgpetersenii]ALO28118.1 transporter, CPA2 family [Leptospira borgpetersenii serovar Ballum]APY25166.1 Transporter, CPA2 family [Leptospira borgpetersenii str. 4E]EKR00913.1 transporter, CPA2 family [Leptospira borgpetersenii serovar Castellonis str. 200801910]KGE26412.1 potassium transporter Kef [Leptospira borgpetersenii serovar Ballum]MBE8159604.1 cation:proton antiporter [Leptospira borgpetersenii serovar Ballum]